jgi:hypothetical protein
MRRCVTGAGGVVEASSGRGAVAALPASLGGAMLGAICAGGASLGFDIVGAGDCACAVAMLPVAKVSASAATPLIRTVRMVVISIF